MKPYIKSIIAISIIIPSTSFSQESNWFVRPNVGVSQMSDFSANSNNVRNSNGKVDVNVDSGFVAGLGLGYRYNESIAVEVAWEYRTNDSAVSLPNGVIFDDGNYASNTFFINGIYTFNSSNQRWKPYLGAGLALLQEIDIDIEAAESEFSYSANGDVGFQAFGGISYELNNNWDLQAEIRTTRFSDINLEAETNSDGRFSGLEYKPTTVQLALVYNF